MTVVTGMVLYVLPRSMEPMALLSTPFFEGLFFVLDVDRYKREKISRG